MNYVNLGKTGVQVSQLCFGTMSFGAEADEHMSGRMFHRCREAGINFFDCANVYQKGRAEEILGRLMAGSHESYSACGLGSEGTDSLVQLCEAAGPARGVFGAKITGGGTGGTVAVLARANAETVIDEIAAEYRATTGREAAVDADGLSPGNTLVPVDDFVGVAAYMRLDALRPWNEALPIGDALASLAGDGVVLERLRAETDPLLLMAVGCSWVGVPWRSVKVPNRRRLRRFASWAQRISSCKASNRRTSRPVTVAAPFATDSPMTTYLG